MLKLILFFLVLSLSACSHVNFTPEARENQCLEYGHKKGTPEFGDCMYKERQMTQEFWFGDDD